MVIVADKNGKTDGAAHQFLCQINSPLPIVLISRAEGFVFNETLNSLFGKPYLLCDYIEYGWQWQQDKNIEWGKNRNEFDFLHGDEWGKLEDFLVNNPPTLSFIRELLLSNVKENVLPIEYPGWSSPTPINTKDEFYYRPIDLFFYWGRSHEKRVQTHGDIWKGASKHGYSVCDNVYYYTDFMKEERGKKVVTLNIPHYGRIEIAALMAINGGSKLSLSLPGAGVKCFRSTGESPINSVMLCEADNLAWTYPFVNMQNCINIPPDANIPDFINDIPHWSDLYDIYLEGVATADKYRAANYINNYILPTINKFA